MATFRPKEIIPRKSVTEKRKILSEWQQSDKRMVDFCTEKGIGVSSLKTWMRQLDIGRKRSPRKKKEASSFITLIPDQPIISTLPFAELYVRDNRRLVINQPVSAVFLKELLS